MAAPLRTRAVLRPAVPVLEGERCRVRPWRIDDAASLVEHANSINVARYLRDRFPHPYTSKDARRFLAHASLDAEAGNLAIEVHGAAVGGIGYVAGNDVERFSAEIGYWLGEALWGRGIVTDALKLVTIDAFDRLNFLRLFALPFADNLGSIRVLDKAGYVREGLLRSSSVKYGLPKDQVMYAKVNTRWRGPESK
jgi:[ribosomal protein S5]-alanine N-acetyltransferase